MAGRAILRQPKETQATRFETPDVAPGASHLPVVLRQRKISSLMPEGVTAANGLPINDVEGPPLVLGVARLALALGRFRMAAMEAARALSIGGDCLMARKAQPRLRLTRKGLVTAVAVLLQLCVPVYERSRHYQFLEQTL